MILVLNVGKEELGSRKELVECLMHNISNPVIGKILVFSESDLGIQMDPNSKKVVQMKMSLSHYDAIKYAVRIGKDYVLYSSPFVKFGNDLITIIGSISAGKCLRSRGAFYAFSKKAAIYPKDSMEDILGGSFVDSSIKADVRKRVAGWEASKVSVNVKVPSPKTLPDFSRQNIPEKPAAYPIESVFEIAEADSRGREAKLDVVIVSVDYNDLLLLTLMNNVGVFDRITVVTSSADKECERICAALGVRCVSTDCMYDDGASFNKGKAINFGISSLDDPDFILLIDADIIVRNPIDLSSLDRKAFYWCDRHIIEDYSSYRRYSYGNADLDSFEKESHEGLGYFQLFNSASRKMFPEGHGSAEWSDIKFRDKFVRRQKMDSPVIHLGKKDQNWFGRVTDRFLDESEYNSILKSLEPGESRMDGCRAISKSSRESYIIPKLAVITTFFNPNSYINIKANYMAFSEKIREKCDLFPIELSFSGEFFIEDDRAMRVSGNKNNVMWQKERLLNMALKSLPPEYTNVAWIDCDILFGNVDWVEDCNRLLQQYKVVQLYDTAYRNGPDGKIEMVSKGIVGRICDIGKADLDLSKGIPGFAWAARREVLEKIGFLDTQIIGGADSLMIYSFFGKRSGPVSSQMNEAWLDSYLEWADAAFSEVNRSVGFVPGTITHLYHGQMKNRSYNTRYGILSDLEFDPKKHLAFDSNGLWKFKKRSIPKKLAEYFESRDEDDNVIDINSYFDRIFVLNLDRRPDRMLKMAERLNCLGVDFERFSAIDGNGLEFENPGFVPGKGMIENRWALACLLSHLEIIKTAKKMGYSRILVFEDDVLISKNLKVRLQEIKKLPDWKLLYLGASQYDWNVKFIDGFYLCEKTLGGFAYAIDESLYDELIWRFEKIKKSSDNVLAEIQSLHYGKCFSFYPGICRADVSDSDIRGERDDSIHSARMRWNILKDYI